MNAKTPQKAKKGENKPRKCLKDYSHYTQFVLICQEHMFGTQDKIPRAYGGAGPHNLSQIGYIADRLDRSNGHTGR